MSETSDDAYVLPIETFAVASEIRAASAAPVLAPLIPPDTRVEPLTAAVYELARYMPSLHAAVAEQCAVAANAIDAGVVDAQTADATNESE